ncbi:MAG: glycosyltransferase [Clostridia bacterium]|nr:glycosyltransferase [Clostridia bacterium]
MRLTVIIPMYNESARIKSSLTTLHSALEAAMPLEEFEILASNDGSTDQTPQIVSALEKELPRLRLLSLKQNEGKGGAVRLGMLEAKGDFVLFTDSDLAYGTDHILAFLSAFEKGRGKAILGSRAICPEGYAGYTPLRRFLSKGYLFLIKTMAGFPYSDSQCGIKGFENSLAKELFDPLETRGFAFDLEILLQLHQKGVSVCQLPVAVINHGTSTVHPVRDALRMFRDLLKIKHSARARQKKEKKQKQ